MKKIATLIIENSKGDILAYLRDDKPNIPFPNHWDLIGGHVEEGETPEEALLRETKEELDIDLKNYQFYKKFDCLTQDAVPNQKYVYITTIDLPLEQLTLLEGQRLAWIPAGEVKTTKFANVLRDIILDYLESKNA